MRPPSRPVPASSPAGVLLSLVAGVVLAVALLSGCLAERAVVAGSSGEHGPRGAVPSAAAAFPASDVLRAWDRARARAFAEGDVAALQRLYVEGSAAGTSDARLLRDYLSRGLRVEGMRMQLLALEVVHERPRTLRLRVTDRLAGAVAVGRSVRIRLPTDQASTRLVELRRGRTDGSWRVASVRESARRPAAR